MAEADGACSESIKPATDSEAATAAREAAADAATAEALLAAGVVDGTAVVVGGVLAGELAEPPPHADTKATIVAAAHAAAYGRRMVVAFPYRRGPCHP
ncbi:hypothetical protein acdb102_30270 [Acidothermaceae bacterium B102]|nr:hypothetical protein acdb102_30270 [Acidothermaceae bacterium B102]